MKNKIKRIMVIEILIKNKKTASVSETVFREPLVV